MMPYMSLCVVMIDLGNLRDQIFPRTGFAPRDATYTEVTHFSTSLSPQVRTDRHILYITAPSAYR